jgi:hypothetical protein
VAISLFFLTGEISPKSGIFKKLIRKYVDFGGFLLPEVRKKISINCQIPLISFQIVDFKICTS